MAGKEVVSPVPDPETVTPPFSPAVPAPAPIPMPVPEKSNTVKSGKTGTEAAKNTRH